MSFESEGPPVTPAQYAARYLPVTIPVNGQPLPIDISRYHIGKETKAKEWLLGIEDVSDFVRRQREHATSPFNRLITPREEVYPVTDHAVAARLGVTRKEL